MPESFGQRRAREERKTQRLNEIRELVRSADHRLSLNDIAPRFPKESERTIQRDLSLLVGLKLISYDEKQNSYWFSNVELLRASEEQVKAISTIAFDNLSPAIVSMVRAVKALDPKNLGRMSDKRALSYMFDWVNDNVLKKPEEKEK